MSNKDREETLAALARQREKVKGDPAAALDFLRLGMLEADGTLGSKFYSVEEIRENKIKKILK